MRPIDKLKKISKIMEDVIREEDGVELKRAKKCLKREWTEDETEDDEEIKFEV